MKTILLAIIVALASCSSADRVSWPSACSASWRTAKVVCRCTKITFERHSHPDKERPAYKLVEKCDGEAMPIDRYSLGKEVTSTGN